MECIFIDVSLKNAETAKKPEWKQFGGAKI